MSVEEFDEYTETSKTTYRRTGSYIDVPGDQDSYITTTAVTDGHEKPEVEERYFTGKIKLDEIAERNGQHPDLPDEERHGPCPNNEHCIVDDWTDRDGKGGSEAKEESSPYDNVSKWEVDYTNKNYVRSKCNKPTGQHRLVQGRQFDWDIDYDNSLYLESQVTAPKGLHRLKKDLKRKLVVRLIDIFSKIFNLLL
ncbi:hypothetical protein TNIN_449061 [Trichonephila inaurata madagascariensis]|uniref:Uncharacterized protein n=1 Tax=Trichonephila inaurata madagascariensis TaxID=2747483 RepID=A0A8X6WZ75_9ARAC|nr:hypothetical protein TNIN_449061 [Trichonephila inaurata madagascariensis]